MNTIKLEILGLQSSQTQTGSCILMLIEAEGNRKLPVIIGIPEAQAIALELEKIVPSRPMTHDLFKSFAENFDITVESIIISDLREGIFFAKIICNDGVNKSEIDARPSDAIAIGLRFGVSIFTNERVMSEAGIVSSEDEEMEDESEVEETNVSEPVKSNNSLGNTSKDQLKKMLDDALNNEDYELAARIRDELNKRS
ncbi:MAG: bifunctional nuclease family protein [Cytophagales bacterium]